MKKLIVAVIAVILVAQITYSVYAAPGVNANLSVDENEVSDNQNIVATLKLDDYEDMDEGINCFKGTIVYDESVFEELKQEDFTGLNDWEEIFYNPDTNEFIAIKKAGSTEPEEAVKIDLTVKEGATVGKTSISVDDLIVSEGNKDVELKSVVTPIEVVAEAPPVDTDNTGKTEENQGTGDTDNTGTTEEKQGAVATDNTVKTSEKVSKSDSKEYAETVDAEYIASNTSVDNSNMTKDETTDTKSGSNSKEPEKVVYKSAITYVLIIALVAVALGLAYFLLKKKGKGKDKIKYLVLLLAISVLGLQSATTAFAATSMSNKGEINGDGVIDYADANLLERHLIHIESISDDKLENVDMNSNGTITITDLSLLIKKIEKLKDYNVEVYNLEADKNVVEKSEDVQISFEASVNAPAYVKSITVNKESYDVTRGDDNVYVATLNVGDVVGQKDFVISDVTLSTGKVVSIDKNIEITVLKEKPVIENYQLVEDKFGEVTISFDVTDNDNSLESKSFKVSKIKKDNTESIVKEEEFKVGKNTYDLLVEDGSNYKVEIIGKYATCDNDNYRGEEVITKEFVGNYDYKFKSEAFEITTDKLLKGESVEIKFESSNASQYEPFAVIVNGKEYQVQKDGEKYIATVDGFDAIGENTVKIENIILENGKEFTVDQSLNVITYAKAPTASQLTTEEYIKSNELKVGLKIGDEDSTINYIDFELYDSKGDLIDKQKLNSDQIVNGDVAQTLKTAETDKYKLIISANYTQLNEDKNIVFFEEEIDAVDFVRVTESTISKSCAEKGEYVTLQYTIATNINSNVEKIRVNSLEYNVTKTGDNTYEITVPVGDDAGLKKLSATKIIFTDGISMDISNQLKIDVLKDIPTVSEKKQEDNIKTNGVTLTYNVKDNEGSFVSGTVQLVKTENGKEVVVGSQEMVLDSSNNGTVSFRDLSEGETYIARYLITYSRHTESDEEYVVKDQNLSEDTIQLILDYKLSVSDIKAEDSYYGKNQKITYSFVSTNDSDFTPEKAVINGVQYRLTNVENTDIYQTELPSYSTAGVKEIKLESIQLSNKKSIAVTKDNVLKIDILKDEPDITNFSFEEDEDSNVVVTFKLVDKDNSVLASRYVVSDQDGAEVKSGEVKLGNNEVKITKSKANYYVFKITADYDLDTNALDENSNEVKDALLLEQNVNADIRAIEMKDVQDVYLYKKTDSGVEEVYSLSTSELKDTSPYIVKVKMKDLPEIYAPISSYYTENGKLKLVLDYGDNVVQYSGDTKLDGIVVDYGTITGTFAKNSSFGSLLREIAASPRGTFNLTQDYDASGFEGDKVSLISVDFYGTINGNGHTIYNLSRPLFNEISRANINNLILEETLISTKSNTSGGQVIENRGSLANSAASATITNVHVKNMKLTTSYVFDKSGGLIGDASGCTISNCSVTNITIQGDGTSIGGIVGAATSSTTIKNCYATGTIDNSYDIDSVAYLGGIVGKGESGTIENCIGKFTFSSSLGPSSVGGIVGYSSNVKLVNNVSLSTGTKGYRVFGTSVSSSSSGNYELSDSTLNTNLGTYVKSVDKDNVNASFFKNQAGFSTSVWNLDNASYDSLPSLKNSDPNNSSASGEGSSNIYIPDYDRISKMEKFDSSKKIAYSNLYKLMPFYDAKYLVIDGTKIDNDDILNTKVIKTVLAYDEDGNLLVALDESNYQNIKSIRAVFTDKTSKTYEVSYSDFYSHVASYKIKGLNIGYTFDKFVAKADSTLATTLINYAKTTNFTIELQSLGKVEKGNRIYGDYFTETTKKDPTAFVTKYLSTIYGGGASIDNEILTTLIKNDLLNDNDFKKALYAYNYYSRWYDIDVNGASIADLMLFKGELYGSNMGFANLEKEIFESKWLSSPHTKYFYRDNIGHRTGISTVGEFIDYNVAVLSEYNSSDDWFTDTFNGLLVECPAENHPELDYRAWTQLKKNDLYVLAMLTLPDNSGYMISFPTQFIVGSQTNYITDPTDEIQSATLLAKMTTFGKDFAKMYDTAAGFIDARYFNIFSDIQIDKVGSEKEGSTTNPFIKNFNEAMNEWVQIAGSGAYAQGGKVQWAAYAVLNSFSDATHETGHNQAAKLFLSNNGRRSGTVDTIDEDYTDGNTRQAFSDGSENFNLIYNFAVDSTVTTNLTTERINTRAKLESYYKEMYEAIDFLDYVEAKAFLQLTSEEKSKVAVQIYYPATEADGFDSSKITKTTYANVGFRTLTADQIEAMDLKDIEDIYDNQLVIYPGTTNTVKSGESGSYGTESIYMRHWYQAHNDYGRTYSYGFKHLAFEMLGIGGYENGYVGYYSGVSATDLAALKKATGDSTMTWKKYKMSRYELMESMWDDMAYLDADALVQEYVTALKTDASKNDRNVSAATEVRRTSYHYLKRVTNDFRDEVLTSSANVIHISSAEEFVEKLTNNPMGYFVLDKDIDLSKIKTTSGSIIPNVFGGVLDGQGHKIVGNTVPLFNKIVYSRISNLQIEELVTTNTNGLYVGSLAKTVTSTKVSNINTYVDKEVDETNAIHIGSAEEFVAKISADLTGDFVLDCDIDLSKIESTDTVIGNSFAGTLNGNGHKIVGNKVPIFNKVSFAKIKNVQIEELTTPDSNYTGSLAKKVTVSKIENINKYTYSSIDETNVIHITNSDEFKSLLTDNPFGNYVLDCDIDASQLGDESTIITNTFAGTLDGNGHKITGNKVPVFAKLAFAQITNLTVEGTEINTEASNVGVLAKISFYSTITKSLVNDVTVNSTGDNIAGLVGSASKTEITDVHVTNSVISGQSKVGNLVGYIGYANGDTSVIKESSGNGKVTGTGNNVGGLIGQIDAGVKVTDCYARGTVCGKQDVGGLVGLANSATITNCYSSAVASTNQEKVEGVGGFIGKSTGKSTVANNIALSNQKVGYKFDGRTASDQIVNYSNNYEFVSTQGVSTLDRNDADFTDKIIVAQEDEIVKTDFYTSNIGFSDDLWNLTEVANEKIPTLNNSDPNTGVVIIEKYTISSADEFITKISEHPDGYFIFTVDLDFSGMTYSRGSTIITETFTGKLKGNGHTIKNLENATLFANFNGEVYDLNINNIIQGAYRHATLANTYLTGSSDQTTDYVAGFAKKATKAKFVNMRFDKIILFGRSYVGVVVGEDNGSTYERISAKAVYVNGRGNNVSTFVGYKKAGSIENVYIQGELRIQSANVGGVVGTLEGNAKVKSVISNVDVNNGAGPTGGFVGTLNLTSGAYIKDSAVLGPIKVTSKQYKFSVTTSSVIETYISNCYENSGEIGNSNADGKFIFAVPKETLLTKSFYTDTLGLDENIWDLDNLKEVDYTQVQTWSTATTVKIINLDLK